MAFDTEFTLEVLVIQKSKRNATIGNDRDACSAAESDSQIEHELVSPPAFAIPSSTIT